MTRAAVLWLVTIVCTCAVPAGVADAQSRPEGSERFEVASIRRSTVRGGRPSMEFTPGGGMRATNVTLKLLIEMAYDVRPEQVSGGPGWTDSEEYTVTAKGPPAGSAPAETGRRELTRKCLQALLSERFHLELKVEASPGAGYALAVDRKGHKMTVASDPGSGRMRQVGRWELRADAIEMASFARFLSVHLHDTVEDRTGLEGHYTFQLKWAPVLRDGQSVRSFDDLPEDSLIPAVQEQLGLRLERRKVATDRYTIERAERPTEN